MKNESTKIFAARIQTTDACEVWEVLLADALDGRLKPGDEAVFSGHMALCPACAALYEEARRGREWLEFLSPEPEVPAELLSRILEQTGPGQRAGHGLTAGDGKVLPMPLFPLPVAMPAWQRPGFMGHVRRFAEPRLLMTAAMAFFSIALTLNLTGIHLRNLRFANLRPNAVRSVLERRLTMASTPIVRYYDHLRFVSEVESRVRELRWNSQGESGGDTSPQKPREAAPGESKKIVRQRKGGAGVEAAQEPETPAHEDSVDFLDASLAIQDQTAASSGSAIAVPERSTPWTA
jgi:hypothetical protein